MKKINELKAERAGLISQMEAITNVELTEDSRSEFDGLETQVEALNADIERAEKQEKLNISIASTSIEEERTEVTSIGEQFRDFLGEAMNGGPLSFEVRAEPILTSTDSAIINKTVANSLDILTSPGEAFLRDLGLTFYPGLTGNFVVPSMAEDTATWPAEGGDASTASMAPESLTLAARRVSHSQGVTKETLAQTNPAIYTGIVQNLVNGIWNAITNDVFDTLQTDAASSEYTATVAGLTYGDIVNMEASIGGLNIGAGAYVTTPAVKAYLKQNAVLGTDNGPVWMNNEVNGYPAYGVPAANTNKVYFGDFSRMAVGLWNSIELVIDPYTRAKQGEIVVTAVALADTGCTNKRALVFTSDVSASI